MGKFFNTAGPCDPDDHYMLPPGRRLAGLDRLFAQKLYFVVHAPRQTGKTTSFLHLAHEMTAQGRYAALHASCETGEAAGGDLEAGVDAVLGSIELEGRALPESLRPPERDAFQEVESANRLRAYLGEWSRRCPRPIVLFLDEIDALRDAVLVSVLRQLRAGYPSRPENFPSSVALIGLRDVRDYRSTLRTDHESLGTSSPFNVKVESLTLRNFTREEVAELYAQHTQATGQAIQKEASERAFELTGGQPWLVNALARQATEVLVPDRSRPIDATTIEEAKEILILRRDTHIDSLVDRLREPRVRRVLEPILAGTFLSGDVLDDDLQFTVDLGLVARGPSGLSIANPIYREILPRALVSVVENNLPVEAKSYRTSDGGLDFEALLEGFRGFWREHAEFFLEQQPYSEAAAQLIFMAWLQRVVNGGGFIDREYGVGRGRIDLHLRWPGPHGVERWAIELKVWRDRASDPLPRGLEQLSGYLDRLGLDTGTLILFDLRSTAPPLPERTVLEEHEHEGHRIRVLRF